MPDGEKQATPDGAGARATKTGSNCHYNIYHDHSSPATRSQFAAAKELRRLLAAQAPSDLPLAAFGEWQHHIQALRDAYTAGGAEAVRAAFDALARQEPALAELLATEASEHVESSEPEPEPDVPSLPQEARPPQIIARNEWIDSYVAYASAISPMTPRLFHESAALWLASVAIARRLVVRMHFGDVYPNLYILWIAQTTLFRKTTALSVAQELAFHVFPHLLAPQESTPEALVSDLAGKEPFGLEQVPPAEQEEWRRSRNFAGQRGLLVDEFSGFLAAAAKDYNAGLLELLLKLYDCTPRYKRITRSQGVAVIYNAYLSLLACSTPRALAPHISEQQLWDKGFWPRFALLTPEHERPEWKEPRDAQRPASLEHHLRRLYSRLPQADWPARPEPVDVAIAPEALAAWQSYNRATSYDLLLDGSLDERMYGLYGRLPTQALKVATILAALDWPETALRPCVEQQHMAQALSIVESWRLSAHRALQIASIGEHQALLTRVLRQIAKYGSAGATLRDIYKALKDRKPSEIEAAVAELRSVCEIEELQAKPSSAGGRPTKRYRIAR
jgi:hypothetical protein